MNTSSNSGSFQTSKALTLGFIVLTSLLFLNTGVAAAGANGGADHSAYTLQSTCDVNVGSGGSYSSIQTAVNQNSQSTVCVESDYDSSADTFPITIDNSNEGLNLVSVKGPKDTTIEVSDNSKRGIYVSGSSNDPVADVTVKGFNISGAKHAFDADYTQGLNVSQLISSESYDRGIVVDFSEKAKLSNITSTGNEGRTGDDEGATGQSDGVTLWYVNESIVRDITVHHNSDNGIYFLGRNNTGENILSYANGDEGIDISSDWHSQGGEVKGGTTLRDVTSYSNAKSGIEVEDNEKQVNIEGVVLYDNPEGLLLKDQGDEADDAKVVIEESEIYANNTVGIENNGGREVVAERNYWGSSNPDFSSLTEGDTPVDYAPWLGSEPGTSPQTYYTDDSQYGSIQEAVNAADAGDTVKVEEGIYTNTVDLDKPVNLEGPYTGTSGLDSSRGTGEATVESDVYVLADRVNISGVEFSSKGVDVREASNLEFKNILFTGDGATSGREGTGIGFTDGQLQEDSTVEDSRFEGMSAGIYAGEKNKNLLVKDSEFVDNTAGIGGVNTGTSTRVEDSTFSNNFEGVGVGDGHVRVKNSVFDGTNNAGINNYNLSSESENNVVDATFNYWGQPSGPTNSQVSKNVTYTPWYATSQMKRNVEVIDSGGDLRAYSATIQGGVDAASEGDRIEVGPGTYTEQLDINTENIEIKSTGSAANTVIQSDLQESPLKKIVVDVKDISGVTIDGFTIKDADTSTNPNGEAFGVLVRGNSDDFKLNNSVVTDIRDTARATGVAINSVRNNPNSDTTVIENPAVLNTEIRDMKTTTLSPSVNTDSRSKGVAMNGNVVGAEIEGNIIKNLGSSDSTIARGISLTEETIDSSVVGPHNFSITKNQFNSIAADSYDGVIFLGEYSTLGNNHEVRYNNLANDEFDHWLVERLGYESSWDKLDAKFNYWGHASGPTTDEVTDGVIYTPWYATQQMMQNVHVVDDGDARAYSATIQGGVDAAEANNNLRVKPGEYPESVTVETDGLRIRGVGEGKALLKGDRDGAGFEAWNNIVSGIHVDGAQDVVVKNLAFKNFTVGLRVTGAEGTMVDDITTSEVATGVSSSTSPVATKVMHSDIAAEIQGVSLSDAHGLIFNNTVEVDTSGLSNSEKNGFFNPEGISLWGSNVAHTRVEENDVVSSHTGINLDLVGYDEIKGNTVDAEVYGLDASEADNFDPSTIQTILDENDFKREVVVRGSQVKEPYIFSSIQDAVSNADAEDKVEVYSGTYQESVHVDTDNLTIEGVGSPEVVGDGVNEGSKPHATFHVDGNGPAKGVTIEGFTIRNPEGHYGVFAGTGGSNSNVDGFVLRENLIKDIATNLNSHSPLTGGVAGLYVRAEYDSLKVAGNTVEYVDTTGDQWQNAAGLSFSSFIGDAAFDSSDTTSKAARNTTISKNTISDVTGAESSRTKGISISGEFNDLTLEDNTVTSITAPTTDSTVLGITLTENPPKTGVDPDGDGTDERVGPKNFVIKRNVIENLEGQSGRVSTLFIGGYEDLGDSHDVTGNEFLDGAVSRVLYDQGGFDHPDADQLMAERNYWGHPSGPGGEANGQGSEVVGNVDYTPWLPVPWAQRGKAVLEVGPNNPSVTRRNTQSFRAFVSDNGERYSLTGDVKWSTSGDVDAEVDGNSVTPQSVGSVTVKAKYAGDELDLSDNTARKVLQSEGETTYISSGGDTPPEQEQQDQQNEEQQGVEEQEQQDQQNEEQQGVEERGQQETGEEGAGRQTGPTGLFLGGQSSILESLGGLFQPIAKILPF